ncbi:MAG: hypothetical protein NC200_00710 [Candidatus Gastranaerophilales bacterium]|nr:hypothetical protein [Candidatus Gastranaerophilales bacterium]
MSDFGVNFNSPDIKTQGPNQSQGQEDTSPTLFTKQQFTNSIMSTLGKSGASQAQVTQFTNQAASIFDAHDTNHDSKWSQQESSNGGASALASFYQKVNDALKLGATQKTESVDNTQDVGATPSAPTEAEVNQARVEFTNRFLSASPAEQQQMIQQEIADMKAAGYDVVSISDNGDITIKNPDGTTGTINIYEAMGAPKPGGTDQAVADLGNSLDAYMEKGFVPVGSPEKNDKGELIGILKNPQTGEEIKFNLNTNKVVEE